MPATPVPSRRSVPPDRCSSAQTVPASEPGMVSNVDLALLARLAREGALRATGKRPYLVQIMGALAMGGQGRVGAQGFFLHQADDRPHRQVIIEVTLPHAASRIRRTWHFAHKLALRGELGPLRQVAGRWLLGIYANERQPSA